MWPFLFLVLLVVALALLARLRRELRELRTRLEALERGAAAAPPAGPAPAPVAGGVAGAPAVAPALPAPPVAPPPPPVPPAPPRPPLDREQLEELIGSVWLQNVGAVLLLLGTFFLILWGYTTGRLGPEALVGAGVALGLGLVWRGDRTARSLPRFGHALIGLGLGVAYVSLYLGQAVLRVLTGSAALAALLLASLATVVAGMRYRVQLIAVLGVLGAFLPQLIAVWLPVRGVTLTQPELLAYLAGVNLVVLALAARAGWSALALAAVALTAMTWAGANPRGDWGWGLQLGLSALFTVLGLATVPRQLRGVARVPAVDLAVVALAPLCLLAATWPFVARVERGPAAILLLALAALHMAAAAWVDARRTERDLWRPLTAAATLFLTAALERAVGREHTPMAWCVEGLALTALGLRPRSEWLRGCGYVVTALGASWVLQEFPASWPQPARTLPLLHTAGVRDAVCIGVLLAGGALLSRRRDRLLEVERWMSELWTAAGNGLLLLWSARESHLLARALEGPGGVWMRLPAVGAPPAGVRAASLAASLVSCAWLAQGGTLLVMGLKEGRLFLRLCAYVVALCGAFGLFVAAAGPDGWGHDRWPILEATGLLQAGSLALLVAGALGLARRRGVLASYERRAAEIWTAGVSLLALAWTARQADHLARALLGAQGAMAPLRPEAGLARNVRTLAAGLTSVGWLLQALVLFVLGWRRRSAFLRWCALILFGLTVLKFLVVDLQAVDVFWRFVTAIVAGALMLAVSYAYQRRARRATAEPPGPGS